MAIDKVSIINSAINYALDHADDGLLFLRMWREGDWLGIEKEFQGFDLSEIGKLALDDIANQIEKPTVNKPPITVFIDETNEL